MKLTYNSPLILSFALLTTAIFLFNNYLPGNSIISLYFTSPGNFNFNSTLDYFRSASYILGHANWQHLTGNFMLILLLGPMLEEKYKPLLLLLMIILTAILTSSFNSLFFHTSLIGASGIAFMLITLSSFTNTRSYEIPLTFIFIILFFLTKELADGLVEHDSVSHFGHIFGGVCGVIFGFVFSKRS